MPSRPLSALISWMLRYSGVATDCRVLALAPQVLPPRSSWPSFIALTMFSRV